MCAHGEFVSVRAQTRAQGTCLGGRLNRPPLAEQPEADLWGGENRRVLITGETDPFVLASRRGSSFVEGTAASLRCVANRSHKYYAGFVSPCFPFEIETREMGPLQVGLYCWRRRRHLSRE